MSINITEDEKVMICNNIEKIEDIQNTVHEIVNRLAENNELKYKLVETQGKLDEIRKSLRSTQDELTQTSETLGSTNAMLSLKEKELKTTNDELNKTKYELHETYGKIKEKEVELEATNAELDRVKNELQGTYNKLKEKKEELVTINTELDGVKNKLQGTDGKLKEKEEELKATNAKLNETRNELTDTQYQLKQVKTVIKEKDDIIDNLNTRFKGFDPTVEPYVEIMTKTFACESTKTIFGSIENPSNTEEILKFLRVFGIDFTYAAKIYNSMRDYKKNNRIEVTDEEKDLINVLNHFYRKNDGIEFDVLELIDLSEADVCFDKLSMQDFEKPASVGFKYVEAIYVPALRKDESTIQFKALIKGRS